MPVVNNYLEETRDQKPGADGGKFQGNIDKITHIGGQWTAEWHDTTNGGRNITISLDRANKIMNIREMGNHADIQLWSGHYDAAGEDYAASGVDSTGTYSFLINVTLPNN